MSDQTQEAPKGIKVYDVTLTFTEQVLASSPADPEVYKRFIESKKPASVPEGEAETLAAASGIELAGWSVFHHDEYGLFFYDYKVKGFLKEAAAAVTGKDGMSAFKSKIDKWVFIAPRRIYLRSGDGFIQQPQGTLERPIRAMTMQGPRTSLKRSDYVNPGTSIEFRITVLPLGQREITANRLSEWFDYGQFIGISEWRGGSYGRFQYKLIA